MFLDSRMMQTSYLIEKSLDAESMRRKVISNNIANVDVPHFKRSEVNFESELKRAIFENDNERANRVPFATTDERHVPFSVPRSITGVQPRINLDYSTTYRNDGNNVDIEKEMVDAAKNMMRHNSLTASMNHNFKMLKISMRV